MQSECFEHAMHGDKSLVISAPTGCGKTVVLEMAIVRLLMQHDQSDQTRIGKIVYGPLWIPAGSDVIMLPIMGIGDRGHRYVLVISL